MPGKEGKNTYVNTVNICCLVYEELRNACLSVRCVQRYCASFTFCQRWYSYV